MAAYASRRVRRLARRLAHVSLRRMVRIEMGPASCPTARSRRFGGWFDVCPAACPMACVYQFDSRKAWRLARRLACVTLVDLHFGGWFDSRRTRHHARPLACGASADGSTHARRRARWLEYFVSIRDGSRGLPDGSLMSLRQICASANDSDRDGPGVLPDGSLVSLRRVSIRDGPCILFDSSLVYHFGVMVESSAAST